MTNAFNPICSRNTIKVIVFFLLFSADAIAQKTAIKVSDTIVSNVLNKLNNHDDIDRDIAIKYLHLDSTLFQDYPAIQSDTSLSLGSHIFWIVSYAAVVNCQHKELIEYNTESGVFYDRLLIETNCDFDPSADHTTQTAFKISGNMLYVYRNYYRIRNEELVLKKKHSTYSAYRLPDLKAVFTGKPQP